MIAQYDLEGNLLEIYYTLYTASKTSKVKKKLIENNIYDYSKSAGGFIWVKYKTLNEIPQKIIVLRKKLTEKQKQEIIKLYYIKRLTQKEISLKFNLTQQAIHYVLKKEKTKKNQLKSW